MKKKWKVYAAAVGGGLLLLLGWGLLREYKEAGGVMAVLPYLLIGVGCEAFGYGTGEIISRRVIGKSQEAQKQWEIAEKDERNILIRGKAKGKAFDVMIYTFSAVMFSFVVMGTGIAEILILAAAYLFVMGVAVFYSIKFEKEM